ncbi:FAD-dependent oxidoreductase [Nannocystis pusilla]|uniref:FAD-dependent oxidoreductase n=1 Tax=Nannocystis pusilla TaxID=889268 RepID=UPI003B817FAE
MLGISRRLANNPDRSAPVALPRPLDVLVVGGGIAGLAAATILSERGARVTVLEPETFLGGRAGAWTDTLADGTRFEMERGFHAFFRQYYMCAPGCDASTRSSAFSAPSTTTRCSAPTACASRSPACRSCRSGTSSA